MTEKKKSLFLRTTINALTRDGVIGTASTNILISRVTRVIFLVSSTFHEVFQIISFK